MGDRQVYVLDRDSAVRPVSKALLRKHLLSGNLSEKVYISATGDHFEPLESATWFFDEDATAHSPPTLLSGFGHAFANQSPLGRSVSQPLDNIASADPKTRRTLLSNKLRGSSFRMSSFIPHSNSARSSKGESASPPTGQRLSPSLSMVAEGLPHIAGRSPGSPTGVGSPIGSQQLGSLFADKPDDFGESLHNLVSELRRSLARAELLQADADNAGPSVRASNEELRKENVALRALVETMKPIVLEHAPHILQEPNASKGSGANSVGTAASVPTSTSPTAIPPKGEDAVPMAMDGQNQSHAGLKVPFEADSPMLRERMDHVESEIDSVRQTLKSCVKSGQGFLQAAASFHEQAQYFVEDLRMSRVSMPLLAKLGDAISGEVEGHMKLMESLESKFLRPLSAFANNELKSANHIRAELERKREVFESVETKYMSNRRGKDRQGATFALTAHVDGGPPKMGRSASSGGHAFPPAATPGEEAGWDKKSMTGELRNAEMQYELCRYRLIWSLNKLWLGHTVIVNQCVLSLAGSLAAFHEKEGNRVQGILESDKVKGAERAEDTQRVSEMCEQMMRRKQHEVENYVFINPRRQDAEPNLVYEGWLWKRSSNVMRDWKKRFFQLVGGQLLYFRNMEREVVCDVHICTVRETPRTSGREAAPPKASFEVISPKRSLVLMAGSEEEKEAWVAAIREAIKRGLGMGNSQAPTLSTGQSQADVVVELSNDPLNRRCFECHAPLETVDWVSINLGVFVCISCSGLHRSLGTHVSKVRSLLLDHLSASQLHILRKLGNARAVKIWEARPNVEENRSRNIRQFVQEKYVDRAFLSDDEVSSEDFASMVIEDNLKRVAWFVAHGKPPYLISQHTTALHIAASEPTTSPAMCEFLLLNGADLDALDDSGRTAWDIANEKGSIAAQTVLRQWAATSHVKSVLVDDV